MTLPGLQTQVPFQDTSEKINEGFLTIERGVSRWTPTLYPLHLLHFHKKDTLELVLLQKNNNTMFVKDTREWTKGIEKTSIKTHTYQQF